MISATSKILQFIKNFQSSVTQWSSQNLQNIVRIGWDCWKEQIWIQHNLIYMATPNFQQRWPTFIKNRNSNIHLRSLVCQKVGLEIWLSQSSWNCHLKKKNKQTDKSNIYYLLRKFVPILKYQFQRHNIRVKISLAVAQDLHSRSASDVFPRHIGGDEDQKKEPNRVTYTCSIIKIHWIYCRPKWMVAARSYCICADGVRGHVKLYERTVCFHASCSR